MEFIFLGAGIIALLKLIESISKGKRTFISPLFYLSLSLLTLFTAQVLKFELSIPSTLCDSIVLLLSFASLVFVNITARTVPYGIPQSRRNLLIILATSLTAIISSVVFKHFGLRKTADFFGVLSVFILIYDSLDNAVRRMQMSETESQKLQTKYIIGAIGLQLLTALAVGVIGILSRHNLSYLLTVTFLIPLIMTSEVLTKTRPSPLRETLTGLSVSFGAIITSALIIHLALQNISSLSERTVKMLIAIFSYTIAFVLYEVLKKFGISLLVGESQEIEKLLNDLTEEISTADSIEKISSKTVEVVHKALSPTMTAFFRNIRAERIFELKNFKGEVKEKIIELPVEVSSFLKEHNDIIEALWMESDAKFSKTRKDLRQILKRNSSVIMMPINTNYGLSGLLLIGKKANHAPYTMAEIRFLQSVKKILSLAMSYAETIPELKKQEIIKHDMEIAREVQMKLLPSTLPKNTDVSFFYRPAGTVGGDYLDIITAGGKTILLIADVAGKGVGAAMIGVMLRSAIHGQDLAKASPQRILKTMNRLLFSSFFSPEKEFTTFATCIFSIWNPKKRTLIFSNAGHPPAIIYDTVTNKVIKLKSSGKPIGIVQDVSYKTERLRLKNQSIVVLYSDGLTEAVNDNWEEFGEERLEEIIIKNADKPSSEILKEIEKELDKFTGKEEQFDDISIIIMKA